MSSAHPQTNQAKQVEKFQFNDFDMDGGSAEYKAQLEEIRVTAMTQAREEALSEAKASMEAKIQTLFGDIALKTANLVEEQMQQREFLASEALKLAGIIARKVLPSFAAQEKINEIEALLLECLSERHDDPRIVVRLPDALLDTIQARIDQLSAISGFAGKIVLLGDPNLNNASAKVEWANGGAEWNFDRQLAEIDQIVHRLTSPSQVKRSNSVRDEQNLDTVTTEIQQVQTTIEQTPEINEEIIQ